MDINLLDQPGRLKRPASYKNSAQCLYDPEMTVSYCIQSDQYRVHMQHLLKSVTTINYMWNACSSLKRL